MKFELLTGRYSAVREILEFEDVFIGEPRRTVCQYLEGADRDKALHAALFFASFQTSNPNHRINQDFLSRFFQEGNNEFLEQVLVAIERLTRQGIHKSFFNLFSSLRLFEDLLTRPRSKITQSPLEFEQNIFKGYLAQHSDYLQRQMVAFSSCKGLEDNLEVPMSFFCAHYPMSDKTNYYLPQVWCTQVLKAIALFEFLENLPSTNSLLSAFLEHFRQPSWEEYLKTLLAVTLPLLKKEREGTHDILVPEDQNFEQTRHFIHKLSVIQDEKLDQEDFLSLRATPFIEIAPGQFRVIFDLFVVEKIFKGLYFLMRDINDSLPKEQQVKNWKGVFGLEFSEKTLLYNTVQHIYPTVNKRLTGYQMEQMGVCRAPDLYIRRRQNVLLFESKDFLLRKDIKASFDFHQYEPEFAKSLYYTEDRNGNEKPKAIMQLIGNIRLMLRKQFEPDTEYYYRDIRFYPIILTHDQQYDAIGLNSLLIKWFNDELEILRSEGLYIRKVRPVTLVNIDSLLFHQLPLTNALPLHEAIDLYYKFRLTASADIKRARNSISSAMDEHTSFATFLDRLIEQRFLTEPPPIKEAIVGAGLFDNHDT